MLTLLNLSSWLLFWGVPLIFVVLSGMALMKLRRFYRQATDTAEAVIVEIHQKTDSEGTVMHSGVAQFAFKGKDYLVVDPMSSNVPDHEIGERVIVYFAPDAPELAQIGKSRYLIPFVLFLIVGVAWIVGGLIWCLV